MADNSEAVNVKRKLTFHSDGAVGFFGLKIPKKMRSLVDYINCPGHPNTESTAPAPATDDDPITDIDPEAQIASAAANGNDPDAEVANGDGPDAEVANGDGPDGEMVNGDDPGGEIPAAEEGGEGMSAEMREYIMGRMGGYRVQLIIEKVLTATDMRTDQGRLTMPTKQLRVEFLTAAEVEFLEHRDGDGEGENGLNYMDTLIVGPDLTERAMIFKKWLIGSRFVNCWMKKWNSFAKIYGLKAGNKVRIWTFRVDRRDDQNNVVNSELRFALVKL